MAQRIAPEDLLRFWFEEVGPKGWYEGGEALDTLIRETYEEAWQEASNGAYGLWLCSARGTLAYLILTDQLPRNMFRGSAMAFSTDRVARAAAKAAIDRDWDLEVEMPARSFFYLPLMHSENLVDQDRAVRLYCGRTKVSTPEDLIHARAHREIVRRFGRFPFRNAALGRVSTEAEQVFLASGGYGAMLRELRQSSDAA